MPKLLVRHPEQGDVTFTLRGERITVGRRADNMIQINHQTVSSYHAELIAVNGHYRVRDLGSTNHSFVEGTMFLEADLDRPCRMVLGAVECDYLPDEVESVPEGLDTLRKWVGLLRRQNDELIAKISEQQSKINILGNARLLTPAADADLTNLRNQVRTLSGERDRLAADNLALQNQLGKFREVLAKEGVPAALKESLAGYLAAPAGERIPPADMRDGDAIAAEHAAKLLGKSLSPEFQEISDLNKQLRSQVALLAMQPEDRGVFCTILLLVEEMAETVSSLLDHPIARVVRNLQAMARDAIQRPGTADPRTLHGITQASDLLAKVLNHDVLTRAENLPAPQVIAVDDDKDLLPLIISSLESAMLPTIGCADARAALDTLQETPCDLILLDLGLPDLSGFDMCACIRALPKHERTPIVFLTGQDTNENRKKGSLKGASDFIGKPFNVFELALKAHTWALRNQLVVA
ncbi:MAG: response regulator [Chthoniobacteraceae bacterium]